MIACYVSGKGMYASETTWNFKTRVIAWLAQHRLGYDTRHAYYRPQFADMEEGAFARMICDPVEYYDKDWPAFRDANLARADEWQLATEFMLARDLGFQAEAQCAIVCFDEAGMGTGVNSMRFLAQNKPILGFYHRELETRQRNISNFLQLQITHPQLVTLRAYEDVEQIEQPLIQWLQDKHF